MIYKVIMVLVFCSDNFLKSFFSEETSSRWELELVCTRRNRAMRSIDNRQGACEARGHRATPRQLSSTAAHWGSLASDHPDHLG